MNRILGYEPRDQSLILCMPSNTAIVQWKDMVLLTPESRVRIHVAVHKSNFGGLSEVGHQFGLISRCESLTGSSPVPATISRISVDGYIPDFQSGV